jgi:uncharacterized lipoprotein YmbA
MMKCSPRFGPRFGPGIGLLLGLLLVAFLASLPGCLDLPRDSTPLRYWVLSPVDGDPSDETPTRTLAVGPIEVPGYLQRQAIVRRVGLHELDVAAFDRWGDSLEDQLAQVLARNLEILAPGTVTTVFPWKGSRTPDLQLEISVSRYEADRAGKVSLDVDWILTRLQDRQVIGQRISHLSEDSESPDMGPVVGAMSRALGALSRQVAAELP